MHKTLLLSSEGSRLRKHISTRQNSSLSRLALAMSAVRSAAELPRGAEAFVTTVAAAGSMRSCEENSSLASDRFG